MKFIIRTTLRIVLLILLFIVPIGLFITVLSLTGRDIPIWNIGIRNLLTVSKNLLVPILFFCYLFSTLFTVALVDKMKIRSLVLLHIPPLLVGAVIGACLYLTGLLGTNWTKETDVSVGYRSILREGVFNRADGSMIYFSSAVPEQSVILIYDRDGNILVPLKNISLGRTLKIEAEQRLLVISHEGKAMRYSGTFPFRNFSRRNTITTGRFIRFYTGHVRSLLRIVRSQYESLRGRDRTLFGGSLLLSILLLSIPLAYAMNDRGWGLFGIIGVFLILFILPLIYRTVFGIVKTAGGVEGAFGRYSYLFPALLAGGCGIIIDIAVKVHGRRREPSQ
jgi:hypothetical protein